MEKKPKAVEDETQIEVPVKIIQSLIQLLKSSNAVPEKSSFDTSEA
jgi:hypothetical protein